MQMVCVMSGHRALKVLGSPCLSCPVRSRAICRAFEVADLHLLSDIMCHRRFAAGAQVVHQDDHTEAFAIVVSGTIKLTRMLQDGREQIVGILGEADCLGDPVSATSHDNAECLSDVELCFFKKSQFDAIMKAHPEVEHIILEKVVSDLDDAREWITALGKKSAVEKVASFLLWLRDRQIRNGPNVGAADTPELVMLPFTRAEIGDFLGLTIETVSRMLTKLKSDQVIDLVDTRKIKIIKFEQLQHIADP